MVQNKNAIFYKEKNNTSKGRGASSLRILREEEQKTNIMLRDFMMVPSIILRAPYIGYESWIVASNMKWPHTWHWKGYLIIHACSLMPRQKLDGTYRCAARDWLLSSRRSLWTLSVVRKSSPDETSLGMPNHMTIIHRSGKFMWKKGSRTWTHGFDIKWNILCIYFFKLV